jgi:hypothetical protein
MKPELRSSRGEEVGALSVDSGIYCSPVMDGRGTFQQLAAKLFGLCKSIEVHRESTIELPLMKK